jgi:hypothetical protein
MAEQSAQPPEPASRLTFFGTGRHPARQIVTGSRTYEVVCPALSIQADEQASESDVQRPGCATRLGCPCGVLL